MQGGAAEFICRDDGAGAVGPISASGLGLRLITASAAQLGGHVVVDAGGPGFAIRVRLPVAAGATRP
jgi:two-component sensor histidine kinase